MPAFPYHISIGTYSILLHTIAEFAGIFIGFRYFLYLRKRQGDSIATQNRLIILVGALFGSIIGSRIVGGLEDMAQLRIAENALLYFFNNKSIAGGLLGGLFGVEIIKYFVGEKKKSGDLFVFPLILAMVIGRVGCFSMGVYEETYGIKTTSFLGMNLGDGILRHPVMLYEILFLTVLWFALYKIKNTFDLTCGRLFQFFMISYLIFRFFVEMLKPNQIYFLHLGTIQIACVIGLIYYFLRSDFKKFLSKNKSVEIS